MAKQPPKKPYDDKAFIDEIRKAQFLKEQESLLFGADALLPQKPIDRELEKFTLYSNYTGTIKDLKAMVRKRPREYEPMFPNKIPFFKLMYKLNGWIDKDPTKYSKPPIVGRYIKRFIYRRFAANILPTLMDMPNPVLFRYAKKYKLFQFLNDEGLVMLEGYIRDAIKVMKKSNDWADFEIKYCKLYSLDVPPIQANLFEEIK